MSRFTRQTSSAEQAEASSSGSSALHPSRGGMVRLALFIHHLGGGGAERVILHLARGLSERGHAVDLVLVAATGPYLADVPDAVRVIDLEASRTITSLGKLARYLRRERPDFLVSALQEEQRGVYVR